MLDDLVRKNRSYRKFDQNEPVPADLLTAMVESARVCPSSRNQQALKFWIIDREEKCLKIFPLLSWAGFIKDWDGPEMGERPSAYILILGDKKLGQKFATDTGICAQTVLLKAVSQGYGGCMIASINRIKLQEMFKIPEDFEIILMLALGKPVEKVVIEEAADGDIKYWRDEHDIHHVPKRSVEDLLVDF